MTLEAKERFSNRVAEYVRFRPGYPEELYAYLESDLGLKPNWIVADIGAGTGISAGPFLDHGNTVFAVEPNEGMRRALEEAIGSYPGLVVLPGQANATGIKSGEIDLLICAQSFHWFATPETASEFVRIVKPGGFICVVWNERTLDADEFHEELERLICRYGSDYESVRHDRFGKHDVESVFEREFEEKIFPNSQSFDFNGLEGRLLSASYMPAAGTEEAESLSKNLKRLFTKYNQDGRITVLYDTVLYFCKL